MKAKTLKMKIRDLSVTGNLCGLIRQLAGVSGQKYRDAHRAGANAKEGDELDMESGAKQISAQHAAVEAFRAKYGDLTVGEYLETKKDGK